MKLKEIIKGDKPLTTYLNKPITPCLVVGKLQNEENDSIYHILYWKVIGIYPHGHWSAGWFKTPTSKECIWPENDARIFEIIEE